MGVVQRAGTATTPTSGGSPTATGESDAAGIGALAAIDVGTNSVHLLVARPTRHHRFEVLASEKEVVRLGSGSSDMKELAHDAMDRGIAALTRFRRLATTWDADVIAVATSAVREAANASVFLERARTEADVEVDVISGPEEARLIHLGVLQAVPVYDRQLLLVDIGGGSTEILVGLGESILVARSLKLGAIRLTERFFPGGKVTSGSVDACRKHVRAQLSTVVREVRRHGYEVAVGSSGTIGAIAQMAQAARGESTARTLSNVAFTRRDLKGVVSTVAAARNPRDRLASVPGLDAKRADIIVGGAILLEQVFGELGVDELVVSDFALREGLILDAIHKREGPSRDHLTDIRRRSVVHLAHRLDPEPEHGDHTTALALQLFDGTAPRHLLPATARELLEAAGLLHNVGLSISHDSHHKHSYYVIRNSEWLTGFTQHEVELIAQVARYHRKSAPKSKHPEFALLAPGDQQLVATLAGLLRVAIALDRTHARAVRSVRCKVVGDGLRLVLDVAPGADASLERYMADERKDLLESTLGLHVTLVG
ncbi:MAG: Exopolyphosphatase [uncultured Acidimicrobiales bacterium]|uniref:Exopolyphosphatase n=1 Tax=uncultured Acidimicrobiales bacterium TaxID=310071 RepID=A0A6J4HKI4_9ACTN|nr:MAG: Exopolyphosphatase [uncultured Acidimicrobiales bacterium]